ncbi:MAG TPA: four-carbon acid sugar kinase family protein [Bryobacteraceae bacterium]|nr:four-carbon acid sugar kinase family protein [Bryobacteraceae bacterium]
MIFGLADDLTGALETGAKFRDAIVTTGGFSPDSGVIVVDTETRHVSPECAAEIIRQAARQAKLIYKKTDSTLRGNIAAELGALVKLFPDRRLIYAPAYPDLGRTVRDGCLFIDGVPAHQTAFARDPRNPVCQSDIRKLLEGLEVRIIDGETNADVENAAHEILASEPYALAAGAGALAGALARLMGLEPLHASSHAPVRRCLVVNGSLHPASAAQIDFARERGLFDDGWALCGRQPEAVARALRVSRFDGIVVFGGDTAFEIHKALRLPEFRTMGEVVTGVPISQCGGLCWITKAGGFGPPELLCDIRRRVT